MSNIKYFVSAVIAFTVAAVSALEIAVSANPDKLEKLAAQELQEAFAAVGKKISIVPENKASKNETIYLGQTAFARQNKINFDKFDEEEWEIRKVGKNLIITGGRPAGTLYGVYRFLNKNGMYFITESVTTVPEKITFDNVNERKKPAFGGRFIHVGSFYYRLNNRIKMDKFNRFRLRNFENGLYSRTGDKLAHVGKWLSVGGPGLYHTYFRYLPRELFKTHPEYFNMNERGVRFMHGHIAAFSQPCLTNPDVEKIITANLIKAIEKDRKGKAKKDWPFIYDISRNDTTSYICKCPKCDAIVKAEGSDSGLEIWFMNKILKNIEKKYPDVMLRTFAYATGEDAPKTIIPHKKLIIQYCDLYTKSDPYRPLRHRVNQKQLERLQKWSKITENIALWDYWNMGMMAYHNPPRPEIIVDAIIDDIKLFRKMKLKGLFLEAELSFETPQAFMALQYFLGYQLMIDPDADAEKLIDIFISNYYGKAAPHIREYFDMLRKGVAAYPKQQATMQVSAWNYMNPEGYFKMIKILDKALAAIKDQPQFANRVKIELISPMWCSLFFWGDCSKYFTANGISKASLVDRCREYASYSINRNNPRTLKKIQKKLDKRLAILAADIPVPEEFKHLKTEDVKVFNYLYGFAHNSTGSYLIDVKDTPSGKTISSENKDPSYHGINAKRSRIPCMMFAVSNIGHGQKAINLKNYKQDEKYHWYVIPNAKIGGKTTFWGHYWYIQYDLSSAYANVDGKEYLNTYDAWFSAKITGPAYVKGSKLKNAIAVDRIVLVRSNTPGAKELRKTLQK